MKNAELDTWENRAKWEAPPHEASPPCKHLLGPKHSGMRISAEGLLGRVRDDSRGYIDKGTRWALGEMLRHMAEMGHRYYAGDATAVDEFLQLYCLDEGRP